MDMHGHVFLSDFGVSASLKKGEKRGTIVGSPCWMAPEIMNQSGHDYKADIWSVGITGIELAMGNAPYHELPAMKVVIEILNNSPPELPEDAPFSNLFRKFLAACLKKEPSQRPTVDELLQQHAAFFDQAKEPAYLQTKFLSGLAPISERVDQKLQGAGDEFIETLNRLHSKARAS